MMKLIDPVVLLQHFAKDTSPDNLAAAASAVEMATATCEARLGTKFQAGSKVDVFFAIGSMMAGSGYTTRMLASCGFINVSTLTIQTALQPIAFDTDDATTLTGVIVNAEKGILTDVSMDLSGRFIKVAYDYGFTSHDDIYDDVPDWLQSACKTLAISTLAATPNPIMEKDDLALTPKALIVQYETMMAQNVRYAPGAALPI